MKEVVKCVIISHKRANNVKTLKAISNCSICVEESQEKEYQENYPDTEIITHPDSVKGLAMKYQWMYENLKNFAIIADDIDSMTRIWPSDLTKGMSTVDKDTAYNIIQATAKTTQNLGAKLGAFSKDNNPITYSGHKPFSMSGFASGGILIMLEGWKNFKLSNRCVAGLDFYLSGLNAYQNRNLFIDKRFSVQCKEGTFTSKGGMADYRSIKTEESDLNFLQSMFGKDVIVTKNNYNLRKQVHAFEKQIKIPF